MQKKSLLRSTLNITGNTVMFVKDEHPMQALSAIKIFQIFSCIGLAEFQITGGVQSAPLISPVSI